MIRHLAPLCLALAACGGSAVDRTCDQVIACGQSTDSHDACVAQLISCPNRLRQKGGACGAIARAWDGIFECEATKTCLERNDQNAPEKCAAAWQAYSSAVSEARAAGDNCPDC